jgi:hypothetical protein
MDMMKVLKSEICIYKIGIDFWLKWYGIKSKKSGLCCHNDCEMDEIADNLVCPLIKETLSNFQ